MNLTAEVTTWEVTLHSLPLGKFQAQGPVTMSRNKACYLSRQKNSKDCRNYLGYFSEKKVSQSNQTFTKKNIIDTRPLKLTVRPWKIGLSNRKVVFQPFIFRAYVSFREGMCQVFSRTTRWSFTQDEKTRNM